MEYFSEFHWWYLLVGFFILVLFTGKGGVVVKRYSADFTILDESFKDCILEATYSIFKKGKPEKFEVEVKNLSLTAGETLEVLINGAHLANISVKKDKEAEFEHWSDEGVYFPKIVDGDSITIKYTGKDIFKGTYKLV